MRILVVEDEKDLNMIIRKKLEKENYAVDQCYDGKEAYQYLSLADNDGMILDVMIPGMNGFDLVEKLREEGNRVPVMLLTAMGDTEDIVRGLDGGADEYIVKPFEFRELLARLRVMLRKSDGVSQNVYQCGELTIDVNEQKVVREGKEILLTPKEFSILLYLVRNKNIVLSREQIEANVWSYDKEFESNLVDVYIRYLRKKIDDDFEDKMIYTIRGRGYQLKCREVSENPSEDI